ncbi:MAG: hypothetical protein HUK21_02840 [Fibrobacteraceae bacterium]|nr:hypothetical protein [Fibrobacteraceae bacterium]
MLEKIFFCLAMGMFSLLAACSENSENISCGTIDPNNNAVAEVKDNTTSSSSNEISSISSSICIQESSSSIESSSSQGVSPSSSDASSDSIVSDFSGIDPLEGFFINSGTNNCVDCSTNPTTSSSYTSYNFKTTREQFYSGNQTYISIYPEENGLQSTGADMDGFYQSTRRLATSTLQNKQYVVWLWSNTYFNGENCNRDLETFNKLCSNASGEYKAYRDNCETQKLELSCVYPNVLTTENDRETLNAIAEEEKDFFNLYWNNQRVVEETCYTVINGSGVETNCVATN